MRIDDPKLLASGGDQIMGRVLLSDQTASGGATIDFTNMPEPYHRFEVEVLGIFPADDDDQLIVTMSTDGGASFDGGSNYDWRVASVGTVLNASGVDGDTVMALNSQSAGFGIGTGTDEGGSFLISIDQPNVSLDPLRVICRGTIHNSIMIPLMGAGQYLGNTRVNALRFAIEGGGNIDRGRFLLYGIQP